MYESLVSVQIYLYKTKPKLHKKKLNRTKPNQNFSSKKKEEKLTYVVKLLIVVLRQNMAMTCFSV